MWCCFERSLTFWSCSLRSRRSSGCSVRPVCGSVWLFFEAKMRCWMSSCAVPSRAEPSRHNQGQHHAHRRKGKASKGCRRGAGARAGRWCIFAGARAITDQSPTCARFNCSAVPLMSTPRSSCPGCVWVQHVRARAAREFAGRDAGTWCHPQSRFGGWRGRCAVRGGSGDWV